VTQERDLVARAARGEREAFETLAAERRASILRMAGHLLGDDALAEDVAQEVLVRMHASLPGFRGDADLGTWLYRVTLNLCRDQARRTSRWRDTVDLGGADADPPSGLREEPTPDRTVDLERAGSAVRAAIDRLPSEQKEAVLLRYMDDLPYDEIARITGAPAGTVASRVFRALERLGREIEPRHMEVLR